MKSRRDTSTTRQAEDDSNEEEAQEDSNEAQAQEDGAERVSRGVQVEDWLVEAVAHLPMAPQIQEREVITAEDNMRHNRDEYTLHRAINSGQYTKPVGKINRARRRIGDDIINKFLTNKSLILLAFLMFLFSEKIADWLEKIINMII